MRRRDKYRNPIGEIGVIRDNPRASANPMVSSDYITLKVYTTPYANSILPVGAALPTAHAALLLVSAFHPEAQGLGAPVGQEDFPPEPEFQERIPLGGHHAVFPKPITGRELQGPQKLPPMRQAFG